MHPNTVATRPVTALRPGGPYETASLPLRLTRSWIARCTRGTSALAVRPAEGTGGAPSARRGPAVGGHRWWRWPTSLSLATAGGCCWWWTRPPRAAATTPTRALPHRETPSQWAFEFLAARSTLRSCARFSTHSLDSFNCLCVRRACYIVQDGARSNQGHEEGEGVVVVDQTRSQSCCRDEERASVCSTQEGGFGEDGSPPSGMLQPALSAQAYLLKVLHPLATQCKDQPEYRATGSLCGVLR